MKSQPKHPPSTDDCWYGRRGASRERMLELAIDPCTQSAIIRLHDPRTGKSIFVEWGACLNHYQLICSGCDARATRHCPSCAASVCATCVHSPTGHNPPGQEYVFTGFESVDDTDLDIKLSSIGKDADNGSSNSPQD
jgi:hypothetical protein